MFSNIGWGEMLVLLVASLVILGPERLPGAVRWTTRSIRQVRDYASGASTQLREQLGPDFEDLRQPLSDLNELRRMSPKSMMTKHLLNGDDTLWTDLDKALPDDPGLSQALDQSQHATPRLDKPLGRNERPPIDVDAT